MRKYWNFKKLDKQLMKMNYEVGEWEIEKMLTIFIDKILKIESEKKYFCCKHVKNDDAKLSKIGPLQILNNWTRRIHFSAFVPSLSV